MYCVTRLEEAAPVLGGDQSDESPHKEAAKAGALVVKEKVRVDNPARKNSIRWAYLLVGSGRHSSPVRFACQEV